MPTAAKRGVVYVSSGEGTTSQGEFFEALNCACNLNSVLFHIQDNEYAISVPVQVNAAGGSPTGQWFPNLLIVEFDGCDPEESSTAGRSLPITRVLAKAHYYCMHT